MLGTRPLKSPSLVGFPQCDRELVQLADELWGENNGSNGSGEHRFGQGRVVWGTTPEKVLAGMSVPPDFSCDAPLKGKLNYTHRRTADSTDIYFVANKIDGVMEGMCRFRATGQPQLWWPQTARIEPVAVYQPADNVTHVPLRLEAYESVFVVFPPGGEAFDPVVSGERKDAGARPPTPAQAKIVIQKARYGVPGDPGRSARCDR